MTAAAADPEATRAPAWHLGLVLLCAAVCYGGALANGFAYDDVPIVAENGRIRTLAVREIWLTDWWGQGSAADSFVSPNRDRLYRPLTLLSFALNHAVAGLNATALHATNVALHLLASGLVWLLGRRLLGTALPALFAGLLFAAHPVHVEAVAGLVGRAEILATIALLAGLLVLLTERPPGIAAWLAAGGCGLLGLLAKETAICYPAVFLAVAWFARRDADAGSIGTWATRAVCLLLPLLIYFPLRYHALDGHLIRSGAIGPVFNPLAGPEVGAGERIVGALTILGHYARLLLAPFHLQADYGLATITADGAIGPLTVLGAATLAGLVGVIAWGLRDRSAGTPAALAAMFLASYALISNTVLLIGVTLAERLAYWPSVPICLLAAWGLNRAGGRRIVPIALVLVAALAGRTMLRVPVWESNLVLFSNDAPANPENVQLQFGLANALLRAGQSGEIDVATVVPPIDAALERARQHTARSPLALQLAGETALLRGAPQDAAMLLRQALQLDPTNQRVQRLLAGLASAEDRPSLEALAETARTRPDDPDALLAFGARLIEVGRAPEAREILQRAVGLRAADPGLHRALGDALARSGENDAALAAYERVVALDPTDWAAHVNVSALVAHRDRDKAWFHAGRAAALAPDDWRVRYNLAEAHVLFERNDDALAILEGLLGELAEEDPRRATIAERVRGLRGG